MRRALLACLCCTAMTAAPALGQSLDQLGAGGLRFGISNEDLALLQTECARGQSDPDRRGCRSGEWIAGDTLRTLQSGPSFGPTLGTIAPSGSAVMRREDAFRMPMKADR